jgi:hypothetical protein
MRSNDRKHKTLEDWQHHLYKGDMSNYSTTRGDNQYTCFTDLWHLTYYPTSDVQSDTLTRLVG